MSRFYHGNDDSSSDSSSEEEELYSTEEEEQDGVDNSSEEESGSDDSMKDSDSDESSSEDEGTKKTGANRFLIGDSDSDSDSDSDAREKVVKSAKDKRFEELEKITHVIENARKIGDWSTVATEYEKLSRQVTKLVIAGKAPKVYIQASADLEDTMNEAVAKAKVTPKKMTGPNSRGLNAVKQKVKKNNKEFQAQIDAYRAGPDAFMSGSDAVEEAQKPQPKKVAKTVVSTPSDVEEGEEDDEGFAQVGKGGKTVQYTPESILKHLRTILESRGKKNTDRNEQIKTMEKLLDIASTPYQKIRTLLTLVSTRFDLGSASNAMPVEQWKAAERNLGQLLDVCFANSQWIVVENAEEWDDDEKAPTLGDDKYFKIPGSIVSYVERLDDEFTRSLQSIDPHTPEYIERLQDEASLYTVIFRGMLYYEFLQKSTAIEIPQESINRVVMRRLEHTYFKPESVIKVFEQNFWKTVGSEVESTITPRSSASDASKLVNTLCGYLFIHSEGILRARAMLCEVYFLALHGHYYRARDMSLMSHLQETIPNFDIQTQILYNRTLVQVGLCAFRKGLVYDAQNTLQEICGSGRQKELLAQGVMPQRYGQVSPEQERLEKQRQLPFHMHINLELLECVYLTCSMLLEIPLLAQTGSSPDVKKRVISKTYRRMLEYHERQIFTGPPENTRDHVMQASKTLAAGEWKNSVSFIHSIKIWDLMPNSQEIKAMLATQIQQDGLRTFLFTYAPFYDTLAISMLSEMFELSASKVSAVVSKMISHEELSASLDQASNNIIFRKGVELSRLQGLALALSDKASSLIESNERTLEQRTQGSANAFDRQGGRGRGGPRQQRAGRGGPRAGGNTQRQAGGTQFTGGALGAAVRG